jgi:phenylpropionate dioxygenase-like ring-hydroxylating dioxygenase large terminal subunit
VQDILRGDRIPPPRPWLEETDPYLGDEEISIERYLSQEWHDREVTHVWRRCWQVACRQEEIPNVGDYVVYDIVHDSVIVVRVGPDEIRGYYNACLHRGTALCDGPVGHAERFRCPFHGFTYGLDGRLTFVPGEWDFEYLDIDSCVLPQVKVATWGGFVFVNLDSEARPLESYLEILPEHLDWLHLEDRYKGAHVTQVVPCNWKVALEAFAEGYHIPETHYDRDVDGKINPGGFAAFTADTVIQYDTWPDVRHIDRLILAIGRPSRTVADKVNEEQAIFDAWCKAFSLPTRLLEPGETARTAAADTSRTMFGLLFQRDLSAMSDSDAIDQVQYNIFPNFTVWGTTGGPLCYRFRPHGDNPHESIFEVWFLFPQPDTAERLPPAKERVLAPGTSWATAPELSIYGPIIDQDMPNLARLQRGLRTTRRSGNMLASYQEIRIRHFHQTLESYMEA